MWQKKASPTTKDADTESGYNLVRAALERGNDYAYSMRPCSTHIDELLAITCRVQTSG